MLLPQPHYPSYNQITTLEELLLTLSRTILATQKNTSFNSNNLDVIDISTNEETEKVSIAVSGLKGRVNDSGVIVISELFNTSFSEGTGNYPFNRSGLLDAFFHVALYQSSLELNTEFNKNSDVNRFISINITASDSPTPNPLLVDIEITEYPLILTYQSDGGLTTEAKPYLENQ